MRWRQNIKMAFTMIELLIASSISVLVITGLVSTFVQMRQAYKSLQLMNDMQQNVRAAMDMVARDLRTTGYGFEVPAWQTALWITWVSGFTNNPTVVQGVSGAPDKIHAAAAFDETEAFLSSAVTNGATVLPLGSGQASLFDTTTKKIVFIGRAEVARVTAVGVSSITISTDHTASKGLDNSYPTGSPVELVTVVTYEWSNDPTTYPYRPHLKRHNNTGALVYEWQKMVADNIDDFQLTVATNAVHVQIRGRSSSPDYKYTDTTVGDNYRRMTLSSYVYFRNMKSEY